MQTNPPSVGNNVKLNPLGSAINSVAYNSNFINLKGVEPSLGLPSGYTLTQPNSVYYFPAFAITTNYGESRNFTGSDTLVFVNNNVGYNNTDPQFNIDINGTFHALSAYLPNLSAVQFVPASGSNILNFKYSDGVYFNSDLYFNNNTFISNLTCDRLFTNFLSARKEITSTIITVYQLTGAYVNKDIIINGNLTGRNIFAVSSVYTPFLSAVSGIFTSLTGNYVTVNNLLSVGGDVYANKFYGQLDIDPFSQLYYNSNNQLSIESNRDMVFAVRPSDDYSTDNISVPRTTNGIWWSNYGNTIEDSNVLRPYFKNIQPIFDYIYKNGIIGNNITIYVDEDIVAGENKVNYFTTDQSGGYGGCTVTGNLTAGFYSTEWLGSNYPNLTAAGILGGDFLWGYDPLSDISGKFSYINLPPIEFNKINLTARYEIGSLLGTTKFYSASGRRYTDSPRTVSFRTYVCSEPYLPYGAFSSVYGSVPALSTWNIVKTKSPVQGRQVSFSHDTNLTLNNLCFEFNTNSNDSSALVFYEGQTRLSNITVRLGGNGIYTYGALYANSSNAYVQIAGNMLGDPYVYNSYYLGNNNFNFGGYNYNTPNYLPGYGLAIIGNISNTAPTLINFGCNTGYTGFINAYNGAMIDRTDYDSKSRLIGRNTQLQTSIILDGNFNGSAFYQIGDNARIQGSEYLFKTNNFNLSSKNLLANNVNTYSKPSYKLQIFDDINNRINFKYINYVGSFSTLDITYYGYSTWSFKPADTVVTSFKNSYFNIYNYNKTDNTYVYYFNSTNPYIDLSNALLSVGSVNRLVPTVFNSSSNMYYVTDLQKYDTYYSLKSPFNSTISGFVYTLNYYASSVR